MGNRIGKRERTATGVTSTWYVRDAKARQSLDLLFQQDLALPVPIFYIGSNALATHKQPPTNLPIGLKQYELTNHLGNVLSTISDFKIPVDIGNNGSTDYFTATVISQQSYYPFGMLMPERQFSVTNGNYRFGFNGKENDNEVKGIGNQQDYGMRIYDPRLGKFLSVDPLASEFAWNSPYSYAENGPIWATDLDGGESKVIIYRETDKEPVLVKTINIPPHLRTQGDGIATVYVNTTNKTAEGDYREFSTQGSISYTTMVKQFKIGQPTRAIAQAQKEAAPPVTKVSSSGSLRFNRDDEFLISEGNSDMANNGGSMGGAKGCRTTMEGINETGFYVQSGAALTGPFAPVVGGIGKGMSIGSSVVLTGLDINEKGLKEGALNGTIRAFGIFAGSQLGKIKVPSGSENLAKGLKIPLNKGIDIIVNETTK